MSTTLNLLQVDRSLLNETESNLISNIIHAHDKFSCDSQLRQTVDNLSESVIDLNFNTINPLEIIRSIFISMRSFISSLPDFRILTLNEQISLFERNLQSIIAFSSMLFFRNTGILNNVKCRKALTNFYGSDTMLRMAKISERLDPDSTLIKLILVILTFSSNALILNKDKYMEEDSLLYGTFRLFGSQNVYVELLWKYMIYHYGYNETANRFARLIQTFLCTLNDSAVIYHKNEAYRKMIDNVTEETKQYLILSDNEQTPLWGKI